MLESTGIVRTNMKLCREIGPSPTWHEPCRRAALQHLSIEMRRDIQVHGKRSGLDELGSHETNAPPCRRSQAGHIRIRVSTWRSYGCTHQMPRRFPSEWTMFIDEWSLQEMRNGLSMFGRSGGIALLVATASLALAACDAPSSTGSGVASVGTTGSNGGTTTTLAKGDPTSLLVEWALCMRQHGDPNQTDPTVDSEGVISVIIPTDAPQSLSGEVHGGTAPCNSYLAGASSALRDGKPIVQPSQSAELKFTACMRSHGVPNYPEPTGDTTNFNGTGVDPNSPFVEHASNICEKKTGLKSIIAGNQAGDITVQSGNIPPGGIPPGGTPSTIYKVPSSG